MAELHLLLFWGILSWLSFPTTALTVAKNSLVQQRSRAWRDTAAAAAAAATIFAAPHLQPPQAQAIIPLPGADVQAILKASSDNSMITYSKNAKNFQRLGEGDSSAGSKYANDNFKSPAAAKRRAITGCKFENARREAGVGSEKDCNQRVLSGDTAFMLDALIKLDCPSCAYGIRDSGIAAGALKFATSI